MSEREDRIAALERQVEELKKEVEQHEMMNDLAATEFWKISGRLRQLEQIPDIKRYLDRTRQEGREG